MLSISLVGFHGGRGLGDIIDQTDPCTLNPSDPICQATAADTAADPCTVNPSASYCQAAVNQQSASLPTPWQDSNTSSWTSFLDTTIPAVAAVVNAQNKPPALNPTKPATSSAAASLANLKPSTPMLIGLGLLTLLGIVVIRKRQAAAA